MKQILSTTIDRVNCENLYKLSGVFMPILQDFIPEGTPSHKCNELWSASQRLQRYGHLKCGMPGNVRKPAH
jgi:hypothetical protein